MRPHGGSQPFSDIPWNYASAAEAYDEYGVNLLGGGIGKFLSVVQGVQFQPAGSGDSGAGQLHVHNGIRIEPDEHDRRTEGGAGVGNRRTADADDACCVCPDPPAQRKRET